jgi:DNA-binding IclR family transcriptional regulator
LAYSPLSTVDNYYAGWSYVHVSELTAGDASGSSSRTGLGARRPRRGVSRMQSAQPAGRADIRGRVCRQGDRNRAEPAIASEVPLAGLSAHAPEFDHSTDSGDGAGRGSAGRSVKSAFRTLELLEVLAGAGQGTTQSELQMALGIPKSSMHALLRTLVSTGWVQTYAQGRNYRIGLRSLRIATAYLDGDSLVQAAGPLLTEMRNEVNQTVHLGRLDGPDVVYLASKESSHHTRTVSRIGRRLPAHACAVGQILLAMRPRDAVEQLLPERLERLTPETIVDRNLLIEELDLARERGYSFESGQNTHSLVCFGVAVPGRYPPTDAVSCSVPRARLTHDLATRILSGLTALTDQLGQLVRSNNW